MTPFLKQTANHYFQTGNLEHACFIFPNRRARSFFSKYLGEEVARQRIVITAPVMTTMNDFFYHIQDASPTDKVNLLLELYNQYKALNPKAESLDDFMFWGDVILSDFDDVDKYLVNPEHLFANVAEFKGMQDSFSYLTDNQREAINRFLAHFRGDGKLTVNIDEEGDYKARFLKIWDILLPLYRNFGASLSAKGCSYEGQVYRALASRLDTDSIADILSAAYPKVEKFVFVGLNALNECEKKVMSKMRDAKVAEFCWDWSTPEIRASRNRSSFFLSENVACFPQAFKLDAEGLPRPEVNVLSVPSSVGQAKQIPAVLDKFRKEGCVPGIETAIVLPDENLLIPVLNTIPADISQFNVTMGYPMGGSEFWNLMNDVAAMQMHLRSHGGKWMVYHKQVRAILSNSIMKSILSDKARDVLKSAMSSGRCYIPLTDLSGDTVLDLIFSPAVKDPSSTDSAQIAGIGEYLAALVIGLAPLIGAVPDMTLELDFAKVYHTAITRLTRYGLPVLPATYFRLLNQMVGTASVPFHGEPLNGLQIMGPLETRALDFDNLVILGCNEGVFPRKSVSSSFIPPELRKGFGLPTYEYQDSVWAYYFYRLVQRATNVWLIMDSRSEGTRSGEESRYIKQLELDFGFEVNRYVVSVPIEPSKGDEAIPKTAEHVDALKKWHLSASALQNYLNCPAQFYFRSVLRLKDEGEAEDSLDAGTLGNVFHKMMENIFKPFTVVKKEDLAGILKDDKAIRSQVERLIMDELHTFEIAGRNIIFRDIICKYVRKVLESDIKLLDTGGLTEFEILGVERPMDMMVDGYKFVGKLDRIDRFFPGETRVVDYKTGRVTDEDFIIDGANAEKVVDALFGKDNAKRPKIAIQLYLYDRFVSCSKEFAGTDIVNTIYQPSRLFVRDVENISLNERFCDLMKARLSTLLEEISNTSEPWRKTNDTEHTCKYCDFKMICGR